MAEKFNNFSGNGPLMATQLLLAAARTMSQYDPTDIRQAMIALADTNSVEILYITDTLPSIMGAD